MRTNLAAALAVPRDRVSVKARSNDHLGDTGRGDAAAAWAHALLLSRRLKALRIWAWWGDAPVGGSVRGTV
jgi:hypothetical protein